MGYHAWQERCPHCGFAQMDASIYDSIFLEAACPVCGYKRWTEEKLPTVENVELARRMVSKMGIEEVEKVVELYHQEYVPLIFRLRDKGRKSP